MVGLNYTLGKYLNAMSLNCKGYNFQILERKTPSRVEKWLMEEHIEQESIKQGDEEENYGTNLLIRITPNFSRAELGLGKPFAKEEDRPS